MADTSVRGPGNGHGQIDEAKQQAEEKLGDAKEQARQAAGQARDRARGMVDERSTQAGERVSRQAEDIRSVADELRAQGKEGPAKVAQQAADRTDRVGSYLAESDADRILSDVEQAARRNPWAVVTGGIVVGFAASRFLKASGRERYARASSSGAQGQIPRSTTGAGTGGMDAPGVVPPADTAGVGRGTPDPAYPVGSR